MNEINATKVEDKAKQTAQILVIDDDPLFTARMANLSKRRNIPMTICSSLQELDVMTVPRLFDVAIVDYYLDELRENLKGTDVADALESTPVILVSNTNHVLEEANIWPGSVRRFMNKNEGYEAILEAALKMKEMAGR